MAKTRRVESVRSWAISVEALENMSDAEMERALGFETLEDEAEVERSLFGGTFRDEGATLETEETTPRTEGTVRVRQAGPGRREDG
ncbi:hypothetical protein G6O69_37230 [Pseudenhygromyxa sp. WMMC2535]|uniref:hypothetical protein n=1 Tax=Pseudenhygromyxa sp. WMMC2535 TaxID=2712867 RepID=UPI0015552957|nr:hypothetical protein [Pseudenhygromyxa sp. WMMC2535]NVB40341.1 hypothetical protein [Pseudenhygromyxa sp. WMMC2535]NVB43521.1 hypothetical protein [Pseudenhygromyxa sp. WMMC2535]